MGSTFQIEGQTRRARDRPPGPRCWPQRRPHPPEGDSIIIDDAQASRNLTDGQTVSFTYRHGKALAALRFYQQVSASYNWPSGVCEADVLAAFKAGVAILPVRKGGADAAVDTGLSPR